MQMKMVKDHQKFDKKQIRLLLEKEDAFISNLFVNLEVPESIDGKVPSLSNFISAPSNVHFLFFQTTTSTINIC